LKSIENKPSTSALPNIKRPPKKRCRILPAGGLVGYPTAFETPQSWGIRGLIETISAVSKY
jgi:hypothetical protein